MNTTRRVPGINRNSGWQAIDAKLDARRARQQQIETNVGDAGDLAVSASSARPPEHPL